MEHGKGQESVVPIYLTQAAARRRMRQDASRPVLCASRTAHELGYVGHAAPREFSTYLRVAVATSTCMCRDCSHNSGQR